MHLSYRGNVYQGSFDVNSEAFRRFESSSRVFSRYQSLTGIIADFFYRTFKSPSKGGVPLLGGLLGNLSNQASTRFMTDKSSDDTFQSQHQIEPEFEQRLYRMERSLQLAYAVGDRSLVRKLEAEIESFTGWRFQRERTWLSQ